MKVRKSRCWEGYEPVPGKKAYSKGSCRKISKSRSRKRKIHKGPRGGKYYMKKGRKVYI